MATSKGEIIFFSSNEEADSSFVNMFVSRVSHYHVLIKYCDDWDEFIRRIKHHLRYGDVILVRDDKYDHNRLWDEIEKIPKYVISVDKNF